MEECTSCTLITAASKMLKSENITIDKASVKIIAMEFTEGKKTFREFGIALGLNEEVMALYVNDEFLDRKINE